MGKPTSPVFEGWVNKYQECRSSYLYVIEVEYPKRKATKGRKESILDYSFKGLESTNMAKAQQQLGKAWWQEQASGFSYAHTFVRTQGGE